MTRQPLPMRRPHISFNFDCGDMTFTSGYGIDAHGAVREIWINGKKHNSAISVLSADCAVLASLALQYGCPLEVMAKAVQRNPDGMAAGPAGVAIDWVKGEVGS